MRRVLMGASFMLLANNATYYEAMHIYSTC